MFSFLVVRRHSIPHSQHPTPDPGTATRCHAGVYTTVGAGHTGAAWPLANPHGSEMTTDHSEQQRPRAGRTWPPPGGFTPRNVPGLPRRARQRERDELPMGTVTFLFSDIVGSTPETQRRGDRRARAFYRVHDGVVRGLAGQREGHIVRQDGDGFFITFRSTRQALRCAIEIQRGLLTAYADHDERARVRIGLHVGETVEEDGDYYGTAVNLAARVRGEAVADQILVTALVRDLASG